MMLSMYLNIQMSQEVETAEVHEYIREYLKYWELNGSLEVF